MRRRRWRARFLGRWPALQETADLEGPRRYAVPCGTAPPGRVEQEYAVVADDDVIFQGQ